jgi:predicted GIY-YIG superfamily endonuclease
LLPAFEKYIEALPGLFTKLNEASPCTYSATKLPARPAVYVFIENEKVVRVGRTKNLKRRIQNHLTPRHNSSPFAFKQACSELGCKPSYRKAGSRTQLEQDPVFKMNFEKQIARLKSMNIKYVEVESQIEQYLLELYACLAYDLNLDEFDTH